VGAGAEGEGCGREGDNCCDLGDGHGIFRLLSLLVALVELKVSGQLQKEKIREIFIFAAAGILPV
jgi:hypothetical protein